MPRMLKWVLAFAALALVLLLRQYTNLIHLDGSGKDFGFWSVAPALLTLTLCFVTREVVPSLFLGIAAGGLISGKFNIVKEFLIPAIGSPSYGQILLVYLWCLGGLIGLWSKTGGAQHFAHWVGARIVRGRRSAKFFACLMGTLFHQGGTISTVLAGSTVKPVCDDKGVSHEELSYIIDSTASPIATVLPFNVWPLYVAGLVVGTIPAVFPDDGTSISFFVKAIPFNFYSIIAVIFTYSLAVETLPWYGGKMRQAMERVKTTGKLDRDSAKPLSSRELTELRVPTTYHSSNLDFLIPIGTLLAVSIGPFLIQVIPQLIKYGGIKENFTLYISEAFLLSVLVAMITALIKGMRLKEVIEGFINGCKGVTLGAVILGLAVTLKEVSVSLGTAHYIIRTTSHIIVPFLLPAIYLVLTMFISFSTGTSWGTYAVVLPIFMPLAWKINPDPFFIILCFAAVMGGSVYGDNCSPISDTTILSSLATGTDLMDHVFTQLPLASVAAALSALIYTVIAFFSF